jgi:hypothetical protein
LLTKPLEIGDKASLLQTLDIKEPLLWQQVANEYIVHCDSWSDLFNKQGHIDSQSLVLWQRIVEHADDTEFVEKTLEQIPLPPEGGKDSIRGLVLVRLLKNWHLKKVDISIIKKLDLSKKTLPWETILADKKNGEEILKGLYGVSLPLYSALYRALKPKEAFYASYWVTMLQSAFPEGKEMELLKAISTPLMSDCLQIHPGMSVPIFKRVAHTKDGINFILETLQEVDKEILCSMIHAAAAFDDGGSIGAKVFMKYKVQKKTKELVCDLTTLASKIVMNPNSDLEAAGRMWNFIRKPVILDIIPPKKNLLNT